MGLSLGFIHQRFDFENATVGNTADLQLLQNSSEGLAFDFSAGINYKIHGLNLGISMMQGLNNGFLYMSSTNDNISFINSRHFLGNFKAKIGINRERSPFVFTPEMAQVVQEKFQRVKNKKQMITKKYQSSLRQ